MSPGRRRPLRQRDGLADPAPTPVISAVHPVNRRRPSPGFPPSEAGPMMRTARSKVKAAPLLLLLPGREPLDSPRLTP